MWFGNKGKEKQVPGNPTKPTPVTNPIKRNRSEDLLTQPKPEEATAIEEEQEKDDEPPMLFGKMIRFLSNKGNYINYSNSDTLPRLPFTHSDVAIMSEGIFGPFLGSETELNSLKKAILTGYFKRKLTDEIEKDNIVLTNYTKDAHVVAELLLQYLQAMPEPLLTFDMYDNFLITNCKFYFFCNFVRFE